jgi:hypothetical protein
VSAQKHEMLFSRFGINYNDVHPRFRKGSVIVREQPEEHEKMTELKIAREQEKQCLDQNLAQQEIVREQDQQRDQQMVLEQVVCDQEQDDTSNQCRIVHELEAHQRDQEIVANKKITQAQKHKVRENRRSSVYPLVSSSVCADHRRGSR